MRFPSGEAIQSGGWDGQVCTSAGSTFVPSGGSVWELGVSSRPRNKADADYDKRTGTPGALDPAQTAFIFVTPRRWSSKGDWVRAKMAEHKWREVRAYDADDLEAWLELTPGIHAWLSTLLGKAPDGVQNFGTWWELWARATRPAISPDLIIAGRDAEAEPLYRRSLAILEKTVGADHPDVTPSPLGDPAERLGAGFTRRPPGGEALRGPRGLRAVRDLLVGEHPPDESLVSLQHPLDPLDTHDVDAEANHVHDDSVAGEMAGGEGPDRGAPIRR